MHESRIISPRSHFLSFSICCVNFRLHSNSPLLKVENLHLKSSKKCFENAIHCSECASKKRKIPRMRMRISLMVVLYTCKPIPTRIEHLLLVYTLNANAQFTASLFISSSIWNSFYPLLWCATVQSLLYAEKRHIFWQCSFHKCSKEGKSEKKAKRSPSKRCSAGALSLFL